MSFQNPNVHISIHTSQPDRRKLNQTPHYHHAPMPVFSRLIFAVAFLSVLLEIDATGGVGFIEEAHDDSYNDFFQSLQQSLPSQLHGFHFPSLFLARRLLNVISRRRPPPDESVPQEGSKHGFFSRRARSNSSQELATMMPNQPVPEGKGGKGKQLEHETVDHRGSPHDSLSATKDKGKQRDDPQDNRRAHRLTITLFLPTWIAKIVKASGNDSCRLEEKTSHSVPCIPTPRLQMRSNLEYHAILGTGIPAHFL